ncbi:MAG: hypothetical protein U0869_02330 [Chloroflexota bacterium]
MRTLRRSLFALSSFALLLGVGAAPVGATSPAGITPSASGWVVVRNPSVASYHPKARDRGNSTGGNVTVERTGMGTYRVTWAGLSAVGSGGLQVSALGSKMRHCLAYTWGSSGSDGYADVYCYRRTNNAAQGYAAAVDSPFVAATVAESVPVTGNPGRLGYAWMNLYASSGTPSTGYNYTSPGGDITSAHMGTGTYVVTVPGVGKADGDVLVTGYVGSPSRCQVRDWSLSGVDLKASIDCVDMRGFLSDQDFDFLYLRRIGLEGFGSRMAASLWADQPSAGSYHPDADYAWSTNGKRATIKRTAKGVYAVTLPGMPAGGAAIAVAYGDVASQHNCQIGSIRTKGTPQVVTVRCFGYTGAAADSQFVLAYTH